MSVTSSGIIDMTYQGYPFESDGSSFAIADLTVENGSLVSTAADNLTDVSSAVVSFIKDTGDDKVDVFEIPALSLKLELRKNTNCQWSSAATVDSKTTVLAQTEWNYDLNGEDWPLKYPECALDHQSPINLIKPITKYWQAYDLYSSEDDNMA